VVLDSACSTDSLVLHMGSLFNCMLSLHRYRITWSCQVCMCRLATVVWLLHGSCYALTSEVVCVGVMDTSDCLKTGVGGGFMAGGVSKVCRRSCWGR